MMAKIESRGFGGADVYEGMLLGKPLRYVCRLKGHFKNDAKIAC